MKVGFVGLGRMGSHMARNLVRAGHDVTVFDVRPEAVEALVELGAASAKSAVGVSSGAEFVFTSLPGPADVQAVWQGPDGLLSHLKPEAIGVDLSTVDPQTARSVDADARQFGKRFIDAPVSGGVGGAEAGTLSLMVGGPEQDFEEAFPVLSAIGDPEKIYRCGDAGAGSVTKLVNNLIGMTANVVIAEAFSMGVKAGVDADVLWDVVSASSGNSATLAQWKDSVLQRNFEPGFMLALGYKDVRLALELARDLDIPMPLTSETGERFSEAMKENLGAEAAAAVAKLQERDAGVVIEGNRSTS